MSIKKERKKTADILTMITIHLTLQQAPQQPRQPITNKNTPMTRSDVAQS